MDSKLLLNRFSFIFQSYGVSIPEQDLSNLVSFVHPVELNKGEYFVREGDTETKFGIISQGLVRFYLNTFDGKEFNDTFQKENDLILSYYPIMKGKPSPFNIQALEKTIVFAGDFRNIEKLFDTSPQWNALARKLYEFNFIKKAERSFDFLIKDAKARYETFLENYGDYAQRLSQQQIALYLGVNPVSLNRIINQHKKEN